MGARWPWRAWCTAGHEFSGFSGGSDGVCEFEGCNAPVLSEIAEPFPDDETIVSAAHKMTEIVQHALDNLPDEERAKVLAKYIGK